MMSITFRTTRHKFDKFYKTINIYTPDENKHAILRTKRRFGDFQNRSITCEKYLGSTLFQ